MQLDYYSWLKPGPFDIDQYILDCAQREVDEDLVDSVEQYLEALTTEAGRRELTREDPLLFACIYLRDQLASVDTNWKTTQAQYHLEQYEWAREVIAGQKQSDRRGVIAPRGFGKSAVYFVFLPLWALAHGHRKFIVCLTYNDDMAMTHMGNLKAQMDENALIRQDYPDLVEPYRNSKGNVYSDTKSMYIAKSKVVFKAQGMGSGIRGLNFQGTRPDWVVADDIEPSDQTQEKSLKMRDKLLGGVFYLGKATTISLVGTVVQADALMHDVKKKITDKEPPEWIEEEEIYVDYYPALVCEHPINQPVHTDECSAWPEKYDGKYINARCRGNKFLLEMMNDPAGNSGGWWDKDTFRYGSLEQYTKTIIYVDPAIEMNEKSDDCGFAVGRYSPSTNQVEILECYGKKLAGRRIADELEILLERFPEVSLIRVETNQGGTVMWSEVLGDLPVRVETFKSTISKATRFQAILNEYQLGRVLHTHQLSTLEAQMIQYPNGIHDDIIDAACLLSAYFLSQETPRQAKPKIRRQFTGLR